MPIKESLQQLMKQEGWTAEQVTKAIQSLQAMLLERGDALPFEYLMGEHKKLVRCIMRHGGEDVCIERIRNGEWKRNNDHSPVPEGIYRIPPSFVIPDLEETGPRYEKGDLVAVIDTGQVLTVRADDGNQLLFEETAGVGYHQYVTKLPPRHDLPEGWEYTGKAACIDGKQKLGEDEAWVNTLGGVVTNESEPSVEATLGGWRHIARKKKEDYDDVCVCVRCKTQHAPDALVHGICQLCVEHHESFNESARKKKEERKPCPVCGGKANEERAYDTNCINPSCLIYGQNFRLERWNAAREAE